MRESTPKQCLRLLSFYGEELRKPTESSGSRFELVFEQVIGLLEKLSHSDESLPTPFLDVARRYAAGDPATTRHFGYDENRQFFLSDLYDYLLLTAKKDVSV